MKITTKYVGPTDTRGSRIVAKYGQKQLTTPYAYEYNVRENHARAAARLASKLKLSGVWGETTKNAFELDASNEAFRVGTADSAAPFSYTVFE